MEPKFQSSFIPKGPVVSNVGIPSAKVGKERSLLAFVSIVIFTLSVLAAVLVFGYRLYLNYSIAGMVSDLENARASLEPETVTELTRLNDRLLSTEELINSHIVL